MSNLIDKQALIKYLEENIKIEEDSMKILSPESRMFLGKKRAYECVLSFVKGGHFDIPEEDIQKKDTKNDTKKREDELEEYWKLLFFIAKQSSIAFRQRASV